MIWSAPLQIALALYFLWGILGPSVLAGLAVMIILIPVNGLIASRVKTLQIRQMKYKDERVKLMNEVLNGIKVRGSFTGQLYFSYSCVFHRNNCLLTLKGSVRYLCNVCMYRWKFTNGVSANVEILTS